MSDHGPSGKGKTSKPKSTKEIEPDFGMGPKGYPPAKRAAVAAKLWDFISPASEFAFQEVEGLVNPLDKEEISAALHAVVAVVDDDTAEPMVAQGAVSDSRNSSRTSDKPSYIPLVDKDLDIDPTEQLTKFAEEFGNSIFQSSGEWIPHGAGPATGTVHKGYEDIAHYVDDHSSLHFLFMQTTAGIAFVIFEDGQKKMSGFLNPTGTTDEKILVEVPGKIQILQWVRGSWENFVIDQLEPKTEG